MAALFLAGCASGPWPQTKAVTDSAVLLKAGRYEESLKMMDRLLASKLLPTERAQLMLHKGAALEALARFEEADAVYLQTLGAFPNTQFADAAETRLQRLDGDQKEQVALDFGGEKWRVHEREWTLHEMAVTYVPDTFTDKSAILLAISIDQAGINNTLAKAMVRLAAELKLSDAKMEILERTDNDVMAMIRATLPNMTREWSILTRVYMGPKRVHYICYGNAHITIPEPTKAKWMARLKNATTFEARPSEKVHPEKKPVAGNSGIVGVSGKRA